MKMSEMTVGDIKTVKNIMINDSMKRRLMDIGLIEGTKIECVMKSPSNLFAYLIRGSIIALRSDETKNIILEADDEKTLDS